MELDMSLRPSVLSGVIGLPDEEPHLAHIGNKNSGRYPRGSGDRPYQHEGGLFSKKKAPGDRVEKADPAKMAGQFAEGANAARNTKSIVGDIIRMRRHQKLHEEDISKMDTSELQAKVNRLMLENNYYQQKSTNIQNKEVGERYLESVLDMGVSGLTLAANISTMLANAHKK